MNFDLDNLKKNHALHGLGIGVLTTMVLKNRTENAVMIGAGVGLGLYYYMSQYGHNLPTFSATVYNNPSELMNTFSATI